MAILVLEDVGEAPYRIERMLTHWRLAGALQQLAGLAFGQFSECGEEPEQAGGQRNLPGDDSNGHGSLGQILRERSGDLGIPVLTDLPVGHVCGNGALPVGWRARLDADAGQLTLLNP